MFVEGRGKKKILLTVSENLSYFFNLNIRHMGDINLKTVNKRVSCKDVTLNSL
jgi:hypothetical protein